MQSPNPGGGAKQTVVEEGTHFKGSLTSTCPVVVHGRIEGDVETPGLVVSASGAVKGRVKVGEVQSQGEIEGEFDADTIKLAGRVRDKTVLRAKVLEVKLSSEGAKMQVVFGETELVVGEAPSDSPEAQRRKGKKAGGPPSEVPPPQEGGGA
jgi:cytoskeletal protein CcmA (bactofilin family)